MLKRKKEGEREERGMRGKRREGGREKDRSIINSDPSFLMQ